GRLTTMTRVLDDVSRRISRFLARQLLVNACYAVVFGIGLAVIGVAYAPLWAFLTAPLRYLPSVRRWASALPPVPPRVAIAPGWTQPLEIAVFFVVLELFTANVVEPWVYGRSIGVSETALLIALAFWAWLWGPIGLLLATPLTACLVVLSEYAPSLEFFSVLLGDKPVLEPHVQCFQRLVARDQDEAADVVEGFVKTRDPDRVYDAVIVPALLLARQQAERGELDRDEEQFIYQATQEIL